MRCISVPRSAVKQVPAEAGTVTEGRLLLLLCWPLPTSLPPYGKKKPRSKPGQVDHTFPWFCPPWPGFCCPKFWWDLYSLSLPCLALPLDHAVEEQVFGWCRRSRGLALDLHHVGRTTAVRSPWQRRGTGRDREHLSRLGGRGGTARKETRRRAVSDGAEVVWMSPLHGTKSSARAQAPPGTN